MNAAKKNPTACGYCSEPNQVSQRPSEFFNLTESSTKASKQFLSNRTLFCLEGATHSTKKHSENFPILINNRFNQPYPRKFLQSIWQHYRFYRRSELCFNTRQGHFITKRLLDIVISGSILLFLTPIFLIIALMIRLDSPGSIFFYQNRVGKQGRLFKMWKFRSMYQDAEKHKAQLIAKNDMECGVLFKIKDDPRVTSVGKILRKFSIDELPQLWNVLKGDMSLVGPRPPLPAEVEKYTAYQRQRLEVRPGITCIWQVSGRSEIPFHQQVEMDLEYINTQSILLDIKLLLKTIPAVLKGHGAY